jgi:hypothetical protein
VDAQRLRLGRNPHDPAVVGRLPRLADHLAAVGPQAPAVLDRRRFDLVPAMDDNDQIGDCTAVGLANHARGAAALNG